MKKKRVRKNDLVSQVQRRLKISTKRLFLAAREWANATFGRRIKRGEAIAALNAYENKNKLFDWVKAFLTWKVLAPA